MAENSKLYLEFNFKAFIHKSTKSFHMLFVVNYNLFSLGVGTSQC